MLVNAASFPGPALWQGIMLCLLPLLAFGAMYRDGKYMNAAFISYIIFGVVLLIIIVGVTR